MIHNVRDITLPATDNYTINMNPIGYNLQQLTRFLFCPAVEKPENKTVISRNATLFIFYTPPLTS